MPTELRVMAREANGSKEANTAAMVPSPTDSIDEEERQRGDSASVNTRGPVHNKY